MKYLKIRNLSTQLESWTDMLTCQSGWAMQIP